MYERQIIIKLYLPGICGNYNGDDADDKALRDGTLSTSATAITESWATGSC